MEELILKKFPKNNLEFEEKFKTEEDCENYLFEIKWGQGFKCSKCGHTNYWKGNNGMYICKECEHQHSLKAGTIMQKSKKPLKMWFMAIWLFTSSKRGVNAKDFERQLGISYPTAWLWHSKLKHSCFNEQRSKLKDEVEVDELYIGGQNKGGKQGRGSENKHRVVIAVEKKKKKDKKNGVRTYVGRIRLKVIDNCGSEELTKFVEENISKDAKILTDKWSGYSKLKDSEFDHIAKKIKDYSKDFKGLHNVVSLIKRWILGTFQGKVSKKHIQKYLEEFTFRFNRKHLNIGVKFKRLFEYVVLTKPLIYKQIIGKLEVS